MTFLVHIPKTGGTALAAALGPRVRRPGHGLVLSDVPPGADVITIVRDPIERFVSAFWHIANARLFPWASPDHLARELPEDEMRALVFRPQTTWLDADRELAWVGHTETLEQDFEQLRDIMGLPPECALPPRPPRRDVRLSKASIGNLVAYYASDYRWLEEHER